MRGQLLGMTDKRSYVPYIAISTIIFCFVIIMAIITSNAFGDMALSESNSMYGITRNQSFESMNTTQQVSYYAASSLSKLPPGSEIQLLMTFIIAITLGFIIIKYGRKLFKGLFIRIIYCLSIWTLVFLFFVSVGYVIYGSTIFESIWLSIIFVMASIIMLLWLLHPEWWIVDALAIMIAITSAAFLGSSLTPIIIVIGLIAFSIYDYIAVIKTNFMLKFAEGVMSVQLPAALIIPYSKNVSLIKDGINFKPVEEKFERGFMVLGTGDLLFPTILAVSVNIFESTIDAYIIGVFIIISYLAMSWLMSYSKYAKNIHALPGLPFLCTGAIIGYIITLII
jgi:presenilin-like A22 family membrane protease